MPTERPNNNSDLKKKSDFKSGMPRDKIIYKANECQDEQDDVFVYSCHLPIDSELSRTDRMIMHADRSESSIVFDLEQD